MIAVNVVLFVSLIVLQKTLSVPPAVCFAKFRWDDCGKPPKAVMYYYRPGSRCEVGIWKGCLPNQNMFHDEYECVRTCIFAERAEQEVPHKTQQADKTEPPKLDPADGEADESTEHTSTNNPTGEADNETEDTSTNNTSGETDTPETSEHEGDNVTVPPEETTEASTPSTTTIQIEDK